MEVLVRITKCCVKLDCNCRNGRVETSKAEHVDDSVGLDAVATMEMFEAAATDIYRPM